jgi:hypothetical protein
VCLCYSTRQTCATLPTPFTIPDGVLACSAAMHPGIIPKRNTHQQFLKSTLCKVCSQCACATAPDKHEQCSPPHLPFQVDSQPALQQSTQASSQKGIHINTSSRALYLEFDLTVLVLQHQSTHVQCTCAMHPTPFVHRHQNTSQNQS